MNDMNFLTQKYKEKLEIEEYFRKYFGVVLIIFIGLYLISFGIGIMENSVQEKINKENNEINKGQEILEELAKDPEEDSDDLNVQIDIIEDIFSQKNLRVSEIFRTLGDNVPKNIWLTNLIYEGNEVRIRGYSYNNENKKTSEENVYHFEENMLDSQIYKSVTLNYLKKSEKNGEKINEFEYILILE